MISSNSSSDNLSSSPIVQEYIQRTRKSRIAFEKAKILLPGGIARNSVFYNPYPSFVKSGKGSRVVDIDGNELVDYLNNFTALIHGHADPQIIAVVKQILDLGTAFGAPNEYEYVLAEMVSERMPSIEQMRFAVSGTEATYACIMAARAYSKKRKIVKFEGGFHGNHEDVMISTHPKQDSRNLPRGELDSSGVNPAVLESTFVLPYNRIDKVEELLASEGNSIAAVIVEPVIGVGGQIPATSEFLHGLRELCTHYGVLLIFDEIVTGFRLALGGAQEKYNVKPDLTALAKILGGGFPVGGFGGPKEIMQVFDLSKGPLVPWSGTFSANPITLVAGIASLSKLNTSSYERLDSMAMSIENSFSKISSDIKYPVKMTRAGSLFNIHFTSNMIREHRDVLAEDKSIKNNFFISMINEGILMGARGLACTSTAMDDSDIQKFIRAMERSLYRVQDLVKVQIH